MLRLRPYKRRDAETIVTWIRDEFAFRQWSSDRFEKFPLSADDLNLYYDRYADDDRHLEFTAFDDEGVEGHLIMRFPDEDKNVLRFGFVIVNSDKRGKGYGKEMLKLALNYAFNILKVEKVTLGVFENNPSAYYCYKSVGFTECGETEIKVGGEPWKCIELEYVLS